MTRPTLIIIISSVLGLVFLIFLYTLLRRSYRKRRYRLLDSKRAVSAPLVDGLASGTGDIESLRKPEGSLEWLAVEDLLFKALDGPGADKEAVLGLFEELGYSSHYIKSLRKGDKWEQAAAAEKLGRIGCKRAAPHLVKELDSQFRDVRNAAVHSLGVIRDTKSIPHIMERLSRAIENREETSVRILKSSLIAFGNAALPRLLSELGSHSWKIRAAVIDILGEMPSAESVRALTAALNDTERDVRAKAAKGLGKIRDASSAWPLIEHMEDPHWVVRLHVTRASGLIRDPAAVEHVEKRLTDINWQVRKAAAEALGRFGGSALAILLEVYLNTLDKYTKEQASDELARAGVISAIAAVLAKEAARTDDIKAVLEKAQNRCKAYRNISPEVFSGMLLLLTSAGRERLRATLTHFAGEELGPSEMEEVMDAVERLVKGGVRQNG